MICIFFFFSNSVAPKRTRGKKVGGRTRIVEDNVKTDGRPAGDPSGSSGYRFKKASALFLGRGSRGPTASPPPLPFLPSAPAESRRQLPDRREHNARGVPHERQRSPYYGRQCGRGILNFKTPSQKNAGALHHNTLTRCARACVRGGPLLPIKIRRKIG